MKFVYPEINRVFDTESDKVNCIVIENQKMFSALLCDAFCSINGTDGKLVVSADNKPLAPQKYLELLSQFVPFDINRKNLIGKICTELESKATSADFYAKTVELLSRIENYLIDLSFDFCCDINYNKLDIASVIKAAGVEINDTYTSLGEKIIDYIELVTEFDRKKLFLTVNLRSYITDNEASEFIKTVLSHGYNVIMLENCEHPRLDGEERYIVDADLCEIYI